MAQIFTENQKTIIEYLKQQVNEGKVYFKSKHIGEALNLSSKTVGTNLIRISRKHKTLKISPYSDTTAVTWRVEKVKKKGCVT